MAGLVQALQPRQQNGAALQAYCGAHSPGVPYQSRESPNSDDGEPWGEGA